MVEEIAVRKRNLQPDWNCYNYATPKSVTDSMAQRVYAIRLALGDGWKNPLPMADFAELLNAPGRPRYDSSVISRIENGERKLSLTDVEALAAIDPHRRGKLWLAWGEVEDATMADQPPASGMLTDAEVAAAIARSTAERAARGLPSIAEEEAAKEAEKERAREAARAASAPPRPRRQRGGR